MRRRSFVVLSALFLISFFSCQKELSYEGGAGGGNNNGNGDTTAGDFRAKIDGVQWEAAANMKNALVLNGLIIISGVSSDNKIITINLAEQTTGTYFLNQNTPDAASYTEITNGATITYSTNQNGDTSLSGGSVTITEIDMVNQTISGTFSFNGYDQNTSSKKVVTEGVFTKLPFTKTLPPAKSTDTFNVQIGDTPWVAKSILTSINAGQILVQGLELDASKSVSLYMPQNVGTGTYPFNYFQSTYVGVYSPNISTILVSQGGGALTIIENDITNRRIKGSFDFAAYNLTLTDSVQLSQGYFSVGY